MPPLEALRAATINASDLLDMSNDRGSIAVGQRADPCAVRGNPLVDIKVMLQMDFVMKDGRTCRSS